MEELLLEFGCILFGQGIVVHRGWRWGSLYWTGQIARLSVFAHGDLILHGMALSPDERYFVTVGNDGFIRVWGIVPEGAPAQRYRLIPLGRALEPGFFVWAGEFM